MTEGRKGVFLLQRDVLRNSILTSLYQICSHNKVQRLHSFHTFNTEQTGSGGDASW